MTPDEVVDVLGKMWNRKPTFGYWKGKWYITEEREVALQSAISLIQDYQKLRGRIDVEIIPELNLAHLALMENPNEPDKVVCVAGWIRKTIQKLEGKC